ncbi:hypothetical protein BC936DRAFT_146317 [Jimgerdemannia flammicorona]|uniref:Uncharacterized protein n=1 Tax=Jimgerdemannia flammicorona TaxID=994334 RepID=A0A433D7Y8_9FUNG|nr:hypothetical protein BC936DRAFT_146317 [Jimgerdemannia flammicorona]
MDSIINKPNRVPELQRHFQAPNKIPLYFKGPRDRFFLFTTVAIIATGLTGALYGAGKMALGKK